MRWIALCLLFVLPAPPLWAEAAKFPMDEWFVVENLNSKDVRGKYLTLFVHDGSGGFSALPAVILGGRHTSLRLQIGSSSSTASA
jgi:hypothetical protein